VIRLCTQAIYIIMASSIERLSAIDILGCLCFVSLGFFSIFFVFFIFMVSAGMARSLLAAIVSESACVF